MWSNPCLTMFGMSWAMSQAFSQSMGLYFGIYWQSRIIVCKWGSAFTEVIVFSKLGSLNSYLIDTIFHKHCNLILYIYINFPLQDLVLLYMENVETSLDGNNMHQISKEEVFRYILTLHSLLENPPGDYPDNLREDTIKGFVKICSYIRYIFQHLNVHA